MVCRQVYSEARLLPFSMNIFVFERRSILACFLKTQSEERGLALRSLLLECFLDVDHESHRFLAKVKHITVFALLFDRVQDWSDSHVVTFTSFESIWHIWARRTSAWSSAGRLAWATGISEGLRPTSKIIWWGVLACPIELGSFLDENSIEWCKLK
jgi:hypothetical protein